MIVFQVSGTPNFPGQSEQEIQARIFRRFQNDYHYQIGREAVRENRDVQLGRGPHVKLFSLRNKICEKCNNQIHMPFGILTIFGSKQGLHEKVFKFHLARRFRFLCF